MKNSTMAKFPVPDSCCKDNSQKGCGIAYTKTDQIYTEGCLKQIESKIQENLASVAGKIIEIPTFCLSSNHSYKFRNEF